jgi:hypothetical protein
VSGCALLFCAVRAVLVEAWVVLGVETTVIGLSLTYQCQAVKSKLSSILTHNDAMLTQCG